MSLPDLDDLGWEARSRDQAASLRRSPDASRPIERLTAVVSGKGGVGKSNVVANLAVAAAGFGARVLVVDGDLGLANLDVLMGLCPSRTVIDVIQGRCAFSDALIAGPRGVSILPAGSGRHDLRVFESGGTTRLMELLEDQAPHYDIVLLDAGAGIGQVVVELAVRSSRVLLVATPEPTSFTDAYATCKTLWGANPGLDIRALINCASTPVEARRVHEHLETMCTRFLERSLGWFGGLVRDARLRDAVLEQKLVIEAFPNAVVSKQLAELALALVRENRQGRTRGAPARVREFPLESIGKGDA